MTMHCNQRVPDVRKFIERAGMLVRIFEGSV